MRWTPAAVLAVTVTLGGAVAAAPAQAASPPAGTASTVAGGAGGPGRATNIAVDPCSVAMIDGQLSVGGTVVRAIDPQTDQLTTVAGNGARDPLADGAAAVDTAAYRVCGTAADQAGNLVLADSDHNLIRVVAKASGHFYGQSMLAGHIYTVAGSSHIPLGDGGPALQANLNDPSSVAVDSAGNLIIADQDNDRVRVVAEQTGTFYGVAMTAGDIYTVAGTNAEGFNGNAIQAVKAALYMPTQVSVDSAGNLVIADTGNQRIQVVAASAGTFYGQSMKAGYIYTVAGHGHEGFGGDGGPATSALLSAPNGVSTDSHGNLIITDTGNNRIRVLAEQSGTFYGMAMTAGNIYTVAGDGQRAYSGDGGPATSAAMFLPNGAIADANGDLIIADPFDARVRLVAGQDETRYGQTMAAGNIYTIAGKTPDDSGAGGPALQAQLAQPYAVAADAAGNAVFSTGIGNQVEVAAKTTGTFYGQAMKAGHVYVIAGSHPGYSGDGGPAVKAGVSYPQGLTLDRAGNVVFTDGGSRIRVAAEQTGTFYGVAMTAGDIYTVAGDGQSGFAGDRGLATAAELDGPSGVATDSAGNLLIADTDSDRIQLVAAADGTAYGLTVLAGHIYTVAGSSKHKFNGDGIPANRAGLLRPGAVSVDGHGNLVICDTDNLRIQVVAETTGTFYGQAMTAGDIYTVAGTGKRGPLGDGGLATSATFRQPQGVSVDSAGNLIIADTGIRRVRVVAETTGTSYGVAMQAGHIYTVLGTGVRGYSGDGGPGTQAEIGFITTAVPDGAGGLLVADPDNGRIRGLTG